MTVQGKIIDTDTGAGIPAASVVLSTQSGLNLGAGTSAGGSGDFFLSDDRITADGFLMFSSVGYFPILTSVRYFTGDGAVIDLEKMPAQLQPVYVTPRKRNMWIAVVAALLIASKLSR